MALDSVQHILYICAPESIHDLKWMAYFTALPEQYRVHVVYEKQNRLSEKTKETLQQMGITVWEPIDTFSLSSPLKTWRSVRFLRAEIRRRHIDLVHILFATPHALWGTFLPIPYLITTRGSDVLVVLDGLRSRGGLKGMYLRKLFGHFKESFSRAAAITSTSSAQAQKVRELFGLSAPQLIRTGVDVEKIAVLDKPELLDATLAGEKFMFSPRFMAPIYNIELQVDALPFLPEALLKQYVFVFIRGKNYDVGYFNKMLEKLDSLRRSAGIRFLVKEYLDQETLWMYYKRASLTLMTPVSDGTPNSALEAMAARSPLIIPNLPYDEDLFAGTSYVLEDDTPQGLATLIQRALTAYPPDLVNKAFARVNQYGNRNTEMQKLHNLYQTPGGTSR